MVEFISRAFLKSTYMFNHLYDSKDRQTSLPTLNIYYHKNSSKIQRCNFSDLM